MTAPVITHAYVATGPDDPSKEISRNRWNAALNFKGTTPGSLLGLPVDAAANDPISEIPPGTFVLVEDAFSGAYDDLSGLPTLGTMAAQNANAVAVTGGSASGLTSVDVAAGSAYKYDGVNVLRAQPALTNYFFGPAGNLTMTGAENFASGYQALLANTSGAANLAIGYRALFANTTGGDNTAIGYRALVSNTSGVLNLAIGENSLYSNTTGVVNLGIGNNTLFYNTVGTYNVAIGPQAAQSNTTGSYNLAMGNLALFANTTGINNTALGSMALGVSITGDGNVAIGYQAFALAKPVSGLAIGTNAAYGAGGAYANTGGIYVGFEAGYGADDGSDYNTFIGYQAGRGGTSGARNTILGPATIAASYDQVTTGSRNIAIGNDVALASATADNQLNIGNLVYGVGLDGTGTTISAGRIGLGEKAPTAVLHIKAGTSTANTAPLKLTAGTNLTVVENGAFEYDGTNLYFTTGGARKTVTLV